MGDDHEGRGRALEAALHDAQERVAGDDSVPGDIEDILRAALAKSGLTWTLLDHRVVHEPGEDPILFATFKLAHPTSGQEQVREFPIPLGNDEPSEKALRNALSYLWSHALREVLHAPGAGPDGIDRHLRPTTKIPKIRGLTDARPAMGPVGGLASGSARIPADRACSHRRQGPQPAGRRSPPLPASSSPRRSCVRAPSSTTSA